MDPKLLMKYRILLDKKDAYSMAIISLETILSQNIKRIQRTELGKIRNNLVSQKQLLQENIGKIEELYPEIISHKISRIESKLERNGFWKTILKYIIN